jgi:hypothetical protein
MKTHLDKLILSLENKVSRLSGNQVAVDAKTRSTIQTAHTAFGGHISRGLLRRGRSALNKSSDAIVKLARAKIILELAILARMGSPFKVGCDTTSFWNRLEPISAKLHLWKDMSDPTDYYSADRGESLYQKVQVAKEFIARYAGKREQKLVEILFCKPNEN